MRTVFIFLLFIHGYIYSQPTENLNIPPALETKSGKKITTVKKWEKVRKPEIIELFSENVYGRTPTSGYTMTAILLERSDTSFSHKALRKQVEIKIYNSGKTDSVSSIMIMYLPLNASEPVPVFLGLNYGNTDINVDPGILVSPGTLARRTRTAGESTPADRITRGGASARWPLEFIINSGYGIITLANSDFDPDFHDGFKNGIHRLFYTEKDSTHKPDDWGTIGAWAFQLSRAMDYLVNDKDIDPKRVAVFGHSRLGKTALWAAAQDKRFALAISSCSGCTGAKMSRRITGETVERINQVFPHWFCDNYKQYNGKENELPVDQHMLIASIAPRPVCIASASEDLHADPPGEYLSGRLACEVFNLYGLPCSLPEQMPAVNTPLQEGYVAYHIREGKHNITYYDWQQYIKFADKFFKTGNK